VFVDKDLDDRESESEAGVASAPADLALRELSEDVRQRFRVHAMTCVFDVD
jgi:hypothetical protein